MLVKKRWQYKWGGLPRGGFKRVLDIAWGGTVNETGIIIYLWYDNPGGNKEGCQRTSVTANKQTYKHSN